MRQEREQPMPAASGATRTVAKNTVWYGMELAVGLFQRVLIGVPVARIIGPEKLGYFNYIQWLTMMGGLIATVGIPIAARKYISEYLGKEQPGVAYLIYRHLYRMQFLVALVLVTAALILVHTVSEEAYRVPSTFLVLGMLPRMMLLVPSNANVAAQNMRANVLPSVVAAVFEGFLVGASLYWNIGLPGVAAAQFLSYGVEMVLKTRSTTRWLKPRPGAILPEDLRARMWRFSGHSLILLMLNIVVWDRSDLFFLKMLVPDTKQVSFFALAYSLVDRILVMPKSFTTSMGANLMAEYGRDTVRTQRLAGIAARYSLLFVTPVMIGLAAVGGPLIQIVYGDQYMPLVPVLMTGAVLAIAKPLLDPVLNVMQAAEQQRFLIRWMVICGVINVGLDLVLIPIGRAQGAMWANGISQALTIGGLWVKGSRQFGFRLPVDALGRILASGLVMGAAVYAIGFLPLPPYLILLLQLPAGALLYPLMLRVFRVLDTDDRMRLENLTGRAPAPLRSRLAPVLDLMTVRPAVMDAD